MEEATVSKKWLDFNRLVQDWQDKTGFKASYTHDYEEEGIYIYVFTHFLGWKIQLTVDFSKPEKPVINDWNTKAKKTNYKDIEGIEVTLENLANAKELDMDFEYQMEMLEEQRQSLETRINIYKKYHRQPKEVL